jgi:hypothetical protein
LQNSPGAEWNYNNTAFGLAAVIVERTSGQDFHVFMQESVFGPLGMTRTMVRPSIRHIVPDMSEGYTPGDDGFRQIGDLGGAVGAGGIYTTIGDLQTWVENFANPRVGNARIFKEMMTSYVLTNGDTTGYGYGLSVGEQAGLKRVNHGGADVAHRSMLAYYPEINAGITTQSNHAQFSSNVAFRIAEAFFADAMESEEEWVAEAADFDPESYDPEDFDDFVGRYALDAAPNFILTFSREGDKFYTQATGQERIEIVPTSDSSFALTVVEPSVTFHRDADGKVDGATLFQNGENHATRLDDEAPAWKPTTKDLVHGRVGERHARSAPTASRRRETDSGRDGHVLGRRVHLHVRTRSEQGSDRFLLVQRPDTGCAFRASAVAGYALRGNLALGGPRLRVRLGQRTDRRLHARPLHLRPRGPGVPTVRHHRGVLGHRET